MQLLHFEGRDVPPYGEPVKGTDLVVGSVYFFLHYADDELLCPSLQPVVFIGRNLRAGDAARVYFQDLSSFRAGDRYDPTVDDDVEEALGSSLTQSMCAVFTGSEQETGHVFEFEKALNLLLLCSIRRGAHS